ncbi:50S ribosomal protein L25 [Candidatus Gottesmanbacteria bacterium]|nr:50S ribosomal protein L25 [Candidatus Gottesmanbacteria bacterium]
MEKHKLKAEKRKITGRKVKKLRQQGILPANIYGKGIKSLAVQLPVKDFLKVYEAAGETGIIELSLGQAKPDPVLVHNLQTHPVTSQPLHVDFHKVTLTEKVKATVPVVTVGEAPAVEQKTGVLLIPLDEIGVEALPADLPEHIKVDISKLESVDQEIKISDLKIPEKVTVLADPELVVVKIGPLIAEEAKKILEEEKVAAEAAAAEAAAERGEVPPAEEAAPAEKAPPAPYQNGTGPAGEPPKEEVKPKEKKAKEPIEEKK